MKYIDADKLKNNIENKRNVVCDGLDWDDMDDSQRYAVEYIDDILDFIESLQQEQPERICSRCRHFDKKEDCCNCPYGGMKYSINENGVYKCNSFDEVEQEQPEIDLEKEIDDYYRENLGLILSQVDTKVIVSEIARHFYELGLNARK